MSEVTSSLDKRVDELERGHKRLDREVSEVRTSFFADIRRVEDRVDTKVNAIDDKFSEKYSELKLKNVEMGGLLTRLDEHMQEQRDSTKWLNRLVWGVLVTAILTLIMTGGGG